VTFTDNVTRVPDVDNYLGESPIWSVEDQALYWINCEQPPELHRWSYPTQAHDKWSLPMRVGGVALRGGAQVVLALADGIYDFDLKDGSLSRKARSPQPEHVKLHECQCDRQGRLWVGSFDHHFTPANRDSKDGAFFRLDQDHLTPVYRDVSVSNGLAFSPDGRLMYVADSATRKVEAFDLDTITGNLSGRRPFVELRQGEGFVDGAAVDAEGGYWLAAVGVGALRRYLPDGSLDRVVTLPFSNPTKPAFGGPDLDVLFVTSTKLAGLGSAGPANGGLYALRVGVRGVPESTVRF
jgi:L-arabinonolactonase